MTAPSPLYGRFTAEVREIPRCSFGHSAKVVLPCSGRGCDADCCEAHAFVCGECAGVFCGGCWQVTETGWCVDCTDAGFALLNLGWWLNAAARERKVRAA